MKNVANTIEDLLEILAGLQGQSKMQIESSDATIMYSVARQTFKGTALTDRQYALMKEKLQTYRDQFTALDYEFDIAIETLRHPLRNIDRSKYIKIVNHEDAIGSKRVYESYKAKWQWIKIRFPFSKKLITDLQSMKIDENEHMHDKGSHEHFFLLNEKNLHSIIKTFKDKNFDIESKLLEIYTQLDNLNEYDHVPCVHNNTLKNLVPAAQKYLETDLGSYTAENAFLYQDRSRLYGLRFIDSQIDYSFCSILSSKIAKRTKSKILVKPEEFNFDQLVNSLLQLKRFPVVILLNDKDPYSNLHDTYQSFRNIIDSSEVSVQFRLPSNESGGFNEYISENNLNNKVDKNTKLVYTIQDKLNKPLLQSDCFPKTIMLLESTRVNHRVDLWLDQFDLVIHYDNNVSQMMRFQKQGIQEI